MASPAPSAPVLKVLLVGAAGGTGRLVASELQLRNIPTRFFVRKEGQFPPENDVFVGDVLHSDLKPAFDGITAVICTLGSRDPDGLTKVDLPAIQLLVDAARKTTLTKFVLCSTIGAVPTADVPEHLLKAFAPTGEAEKYLRSSGVPYTIIRPGRLVDSPMEEPRAIERKAVALALVEALFRPASNDAVYELNQSRLAASKADSVLGLQVP